LFHDVGALRFGPSLYSAVLDGVAQDTHALGLHFEDIARLHENRRLARRTNNSELM
jgi:hypothetical protein